MNRKTIFAFLLVVFVLNVIQASGQTTRFTQRGNLGFSANGTYDIQFALFDVLLGGAQQGSTQTYLSVIVVNGDYSVNVDFGQCSSCFNGADRFLEVSYRPSGGGAYTIIAPRQQITSAPYAIRSLSAATADSATNTTQLGGLPASSFIQNTTSQQAGSFSVAGDGTAGGTLSGNSVNSGTQFNINGSRVLGIAGTDSLFAGISAGASNSSGFSNSFFGGQAGYLTTTGYRNSFFGSQAGQANTTGVGNSFFGAGAGFSNTTASGNSFFGIFAGNYNTTGSSNAFFGQFSGYSTNLGSENAFFGTNTGYSNTTGMANTFLGSNTGWNNTTGLNNTFVGRSAGSLNTTGARNTLVGDSTSVSANNLTNATAIGASAQVSQSNSLVLGSINGVNWATADTKVGIGTTAPSHRLTVIDPLSGGLRVQTNTSGGTVASFASNGDFQIDAPFIPGGRFVVKENGNTGIGTSAPQDRLDVAGILRVSALGSAGSIQLCRNASNQISGCSSSLRYKTNLAPFRGGLDLVSRLQPITFNWKSNGEPDLGLGAEDVAKVEPLLVTHNTNGQIEGVKYDRVAVVLLNAVKEQQHLIEQQQQQIDVLKKLVCSSRRKAKACQ